jgi:probable HAF family extracellular repeat protein
MQDLGTLGGVTSIGYGISDAGAVVGASQTADGSFHAFVSQNGLMKNLDMLNTADSYVYGINGSGVAVGGAECRASLRSTRISTATVR